MKTSLAKMSFFNILGTALIFSLILGFFVYQVINNSYKERVVELETNYMLKNKELVKNEVQRAVKKIETVRELAFKTHLLSLEEKVNFVQSVIDTAYKADIDIDFLLKRYRKELDLFKWDNQSGYFYIFDQKGDILYHGSNKKLETSNIFELAKNNKELAEFLSNSMDKNENLGKYDWYKPNTDKNKLHAKYVYVRKHMGYNIYIAAGVYKDELDRKTQHILFKEIEQDRFGDGKYGYFWIQDTNSVMIMHPYTKDLVGKDLSTFKTIDGQYLFKNTVELLKDKDGGFIEYIWYLPGKDKQDTKITYVHKIKDWDFIIGSGFYLDELKELLKDEKEKLNSSLNENLEKILLTLTVLIFISLIVARYIANRIERVELAQKEQFSMLEQYKQILDKSAVVSKTDLSGRIAYINDVFIKVSGFTRDEAIGRPHNIVRHPDTPKTQFKDLWKTIRQGNVWTGIIKNKRKDGESYYNSTTILPLKDSDGNIVEYISAGTDITELIENRSKLKNIFKTDSLTGLGNRVSLIDNIGKEDDGVLVLINIDRFKEINDSYGHDIGDSVIKEFAQRLFNFFNDDKYILYRVQADVFAIFTNIITQDEVVKKVSEYMSTLGKESYLIEDNKFILTYTAGISSECENLFAYSDIALSEAKKKKVKIKEYDPSMKNIEEFKNNIEWVDRLHKAIGDDNIVPFFQPIYNYNTNKIEKYECLMRLVCGDSVIPPGEYLPIAKKTGLYPDLTYKMAEKAMAKFSTNDMEFSINLSVEDLMNEELMTFIYDNAEQKNIFIRMVLEIVESEEIEDSEQIAKTIKMFKDKGAKVAIDDFGSGYSNYEYLISLQADYVKIDGSIVNHLLDDDRTRDVVRSIVAFSKKSNMKTIAEFVSSKELDELVRELGVDYAQGYYYGKAEKDLIS